LYENREKKKGKVGLEKKERGKKKVKERKKFKRKREISRSVERKHVPSGHTLPSLTESDNR
jgi:hypothetical protein